MNLLEPLVLVPNDKLPQGREVVIVPLNLLIFDNVDEMEEGINRLPDMSHFWSGNYLLFRLTVALVLHGLICYDVGDLINRHHLVARVCVAIIEPVFYIF